MLACLGVVALSCFLGCTPSKNTLAIGAISPFTGDGANYGKAARTGIDMAVDEINANGGINGKKLSVIYEDDAGSPQLAISAFQKLATVDKVPAVLGPFYSGNVLACAPQANQLKVILLSGSATSDNLSQAGKFVFRDCPNNNVQATTIAEFALKQLGLKTAFVIYRNDDYGVTLRNAFQQVFPSQGGRVLGVEAAPPDATDLRAQLTRVKAASPDFIFAAVHYTEGGTLLRQARELGIRATVIGTDGGYDPQLMKIAGDSANGSYWATVGWANEGSNPVVAQFKELYHKRYGIDPGAYSGLYYDATHVLAKALSAAATPRGDALQQAMMQAEWEGPTGLTKFNADGGVSKPFAMYEVKGGQFAPLSINTN